MKRRSALRGMVAAGLIPAAPFSALAMASKELAKSPVLLNLKDQFADALARAPVLLGYATASKPDFHTKRVETKGEWPAKLKGSLYRNGPAQHEIGNFRYQHWFDGDGMLQAFHLKKDQTVEHRARMIRTRKYLAESKARRALYPGFGSSPPDARGTASADEINVANISVLSHHSKLFALWEGGSAYEMDRDSLSTIGQHSFSAPTEGVPFSAHPRVESDGTLWNFGYASAAKKLVLWHLGLNGDVVKTGLVNCDPISMVHDFVITERHLVILVCPLHYNHEKEASNFLDTHEWHADRATQVLVVDKNDFSSVQRMELPAQWIFHFSNAWEDNQGIIRFEAARSPDASLLNTRFRDIMRGVLSPAAPSHLYSYRIDTKKGRVWESAIRTDGSCDFPVINPASVGRRHAQLALLSENQSPHPGLNQLSLLNMSTQKEQVFRYPDHLVPEEHLLVGKDSGTGKLPWLLGTALNTAEKRTELHLFRTENLNAGPIASARLPYALPLGLHGKFVTA